jgi:hypothetical protein
MTWLKDKFKSVSKIQILAVLLILIGLAVMIPRVMGMREFNKELEFARKNNFAEGNVSPELMRPWMSVRYIAVAAGVPQKYLFDAAGIPPRRENSMISVSRLNQQMGLGGEKGKPELLIQLRKAIEAYRKNPVATGLLERGVQDWMSIEYIANSIGVPAAEIFSELGLPMEGNAYVPLGPLSDRVDYAGGPRALTQAIQRIVDAQKAQP